MHVLMFLGPGMVAFVALEILRGTDDKAVNG